MNENHISAIVENPEDYHVYNCYEQFLLDNLKSKTKQDKIKQAIKNEIGYAIDEYDDNAKVKKLVNFTIDFVTNKIKDILLDVSEEYDDPQAGIIIDRPSEFCCNQHWD